MDADSDTGGRSELSEEEAGSDDEHISSDSAGKSLPAGTTRLGPWGCYSRCTSWVFGSGAITTSAHLVLGTCIWLGKVDVSVAPASV